MTTHRQTNMLRMRTLTLKTFPFVLLLSICVPVIVQAAKPPSSRLYRLNILPILQSRCFSCHGSETQEGDIRLDNLGWGSAAGSPPAGSNQSDTRRKWPTAQNHELEYDNRLKTCSKDLFLEVSWLNLSLYNY